MNHKPHPVGANQASFYRAPGGKARWPAKTQPGDGRVALPQRRTPGRPVPRLPGDGLADMPRWPGIDVCHVGRPYNTPGF